MVAFFVEAINTNEGRIEKVKQSFEESVPPFLSEVFRYLHKSLQK